MRRSKAIASALTLILILGLAVLAIGCGGDDTEETTTTEAEEETTTTEAAEETTTTEAKVYRIGTTQIVSHPALDAVVEGFKEALAEEGFVEGENVEYDIQNAQGEMATASSIAQKFVSDDVDLILSVATPTSQAAAKATTDIPIVFSAVTDPVAAGLLEDPDAPQGNVTGVSDMLPLEPHLELIQTLVPDAQTIGLLYNAGEANSVALVEKEKEMAADMGLETEEATAAKSSEVQSAAQSLIGRVDAISVLTDNTVVTGLESVVQIAQENDIPLISGDIDSVERGAAAAYAFDYKDLGRQTGRMVARILNGQSISDTPVEYAEDLQLAINPTSAEAMGLTIPEDIQSSADEIF